MALTAQQLSDARRFMGYGALGADIAANDSSDSAYGFVSPGVYQTLYHRLTHLTAEAESTVINVYLNNLIILEAAIVSASDNLDTDAAAVWKHNPREVSDRLALFDEWRRRLCVYIGLAPGPGLGGGSNTKIRRG